MKNKKLKNNLEVEKKFKIINPEEIGAVTDILLNKGFNHDRTEKQTDIYWDTDDFNIINLKRGLRQRIVNDKSSLEFKSLFMDEKGNYTVEEIQLDLKTQTGLDNLKDILVGRLELLKENKFNNLKTGEVDEVFTSLGLIKAVSLKKKRHIFSVNGHEYDILVDEIKSLPNYLEIEVYKGGYRKLSKIFKNITKNTDLQLSPTNDSYLDILFQSNPKITSSAEFIQKYKNNHDWNVLKTEREIVKKLFSETN